MEDVIHLSGRYGFIHKLVPVGANLWHLEPDKKSAGTYRLIGEYPNNIKAIDPEGGPFLSVGSKVNDYVIKSITSDGIFELIKENKNENN